MKERRALGAPPAGGAALRLPDAKVACGACTLCCRGEPIELMPEAGDDPARYGTEMMPSRVYRRLAHFLPQQDGHCLYLVDDKCSIYEKRPALCRIYSCVEDYRVTPRAERKRRLKAGLSNPAILARGRELHEAGHE